MVSETLNPPIAAPANPSPAPVSPPASVAPPHAAARDAHGGEPVRHIVSFYVYEAPVRVWHWVTVISILALSITGYLIGAPAHSNMGDASAVSSMAYVREVHFIFGWVLALGALWRAYWAIVGTHHDRLIFYIPFWDKKWWKDAWGVMKWYLFLAPEEHRWVGHNPLARAAALFMFTLGTTFMIFSGFAMYGEQLGGHSAISHAFGWVLSLAGSSMMLRTLHHWGMYYLLAYVIIHVYFAIRDDVMGRVSTISSIVNGWRTFRDSGE